MVNELPPQSKSSASEAVAATFEVVLELTESELVDRQHLELKVGRAFYEAGVALRELRDRRLYRSTHRTFEEYCRDRFGFQRRHSYQLLEAASVVDNLCANGAQSKVEGEIHIAQILPTSERQVRSLTTLAPDEQCEIWQQAVAEAGGKIPSGRIVKEIVERLKERDATPLYIPFQAGDVILIRGLGNPNLRKYDGQWAITLQINEYTVTVALARKNTSVKPQFLEAVDPKYWSEIKAVHERITQLQLSCNLDPAEDAVLEALRHRICFTPRQMLLLERMEQDYDLPNQQFRQ